MAENKLIKVIEKEISSNNKILSECHNISSEMDRIIELFNSEDLVLINDEDIVVLKKNIELSPDEERLLVAFAKLDPSHNELFKNLGLDKDQKEKILNIKDKIEKVIQKQNEISEEEIRNRIKHLKVILSKLNNNDLNLITEIDEINELMNKYSIPLQDQVEIYVKINKINSNVFANYKVGYEDDVIDESSLAETNISEEELQKLFDNLNCGLNINNFPKDLKLRLLKYGDTKTIAEIIEFIKANKEINHLLVENEVLTKILLYSNTAILIKVLELGHMHNIEAAFKKLPTIFFPTVRERRKISGKKGGESVTVETGSFNNFYKNIELLEELKIPVEQAYNDCITFFQASHTTVRKNLNNLYMYNISMMDEDGNYRKGLTTLFGSNLLKNIDVALELGLYEYIKENISRVANFENMYRIKYANKLYKQHKLQEKPSPFKVHKGNSERLALSREYYAKESKFGSQPENTFEMYEAVSVNVPDKKIYEGIIASSDNDVISGLSTSDPIIRQLDNLYMVNAFIYNIDGIYISRYKVLRLYETLISNPNIESSKNLLLYVVTKYSMLDKDELEIIKESINKISFSKHKGLK